MPEAYPFWSLPIFKPKKCSFCLIHFEVFFFLQMYGQREAGWTDGRRRGRGPAGTRPVCAAAASSSRAAAGGCTPPPPPRGPPAPTPPAPAPACGLPAAPGSPRPQRTALLLLGAALPGGCAPLPAGGGVGGQRSAGSAPRTALSGASGPSCPLICSLRYSLQPHSSPRSSSQDDPMGPQPCPSCPPPRLPLLCPSSLSL